MRAPSPKSPRRTWPRRFGLKPRASSGKTRRGPMAFKNRVLESRVARMELARFQTSETLAELLADVCQGKTRLEEVERIDLIPFLQSRLTSVQNRELQEARRSHCRCRTDDRVGWPTNPGARPILAVRLQELFGWSETPRLARGRVPVLLHLLGPNNRPVQITDDLKSFWTTTYHQVRKDLRRRYPKHAWPEDPFKARPPKAL